MLYFIRAMVYLTELFFLQTSLIISSTI